MQGSAVVKWWSVVVEQSDGVEWWSGVVERSEVVWNGVE